MSSLRTLTLTSSPAFEEPARVPTAPLPIGHASDLVVIAEPTVLVGTVEVAPSVEVIEPTANPRDSRPDWVDDFVWETGPDDVECDYEPSAAELAEYSAMIARDAYADKDAEEAGLLDWWIRNRETLYRDLSPICLAEAGVASGHPSYDEA